MVTIQSGANSPLVLINTFTVAPENQDRLIEILNEMTEEVLKDLPGFVSASIHHGHDGNKVATYAQWEDRASYDAMLENENVKRQMQAATKLALKIELVIYEVDECHEKESHEPIPKFDLEARDISAD